MSFVDDYEATLHGRLVSRQPTGELVRKWEKAKGRHSNRFWAQEWIDLAIRRGIELAKSFNFL